MTDVEDRIDGNVVHMLATGDHYYLSRYKLTAAGWLAVGKAAECCLRARGKWAEQGDSVARRVLQMLREEQAARQ
jgi:hypothetical protein